MAAGIGISVFSQLRDGTQKVELPGATNVVYSDRRSQAGPLTFDLPGVRLPDQNGAYTIPIKSVLEAGVHEVGVRRGGVVVWLGPLRAVNENIDAFGTSTVTISAESLEGYLASWPPITGPMAHAAGDGTYTNVDQATIAKDMVDHQQAKGGGNYANLDTSQVAATGVLLTRTAYDAWRNLDIFTEIQNLAGLSSPAGFIWRIRPTDRAFLVSYPRRGQRHLEVTLGVENIIAMTRTLDSTQQGSQVVGAGSGSSATSLRTILQDSTAVSKYGLTGKVYAGSGITDQTTLTANTQQMLNVVKGVPNVLSPTVRWSANLPYGSIGIDDEVRIIYPSPYEAIDEFRVIVGIDYTPQLDETAVIHLAPIGS